MHSEQFQQSLPLKEALEQAQKIAIFGHQSIDGDALGSMFGLGRQLEKMGKEVFYFTPDAPSEQFHFIGLETLQTEFDYGEYDLLVLVDMAHPYRVEKFYQGHESYFNTDKLLIIDHHLPDIVKEDEESLQTSLLFRDATCISCSEIIFELTSQWRDLIDPEIATVLYMGIVTDSGNFCNDEGDESIRVMQDAVELLKLGAKKREVVLNVLRSRSVEEIRFMQKIIDKLQQDGDIFYSRYTKEEVEEAGIHLAKAEYALSIMCEIKEGELFILGKEKPEGWSIKFSLRGKGKYHCRDLAAHFWGGGHENAAWCSVDFTWSADEAVKAFVKKIKSLI